MVSAPAVVYATPRLGSGEHSSLKEKQATYLHNFDHRNDVRRATCRRLHRFPQDRLTSTSLMNKVIGASRLICSFGRLISMVMQAFTGIQEPIWQPVVSFHNFLGCLLFLSSPK